MKYNNKMKNPYINDYCKQRYSAGKRGIDWQFTYDEWVSWWGTDITKRGRGKGKLVMARTKDQGPYHPSNVRKETYENNIIERNILHTGDKRSDETKLKISEASLGKAKSPEHVQSFRNIQLTCPHCNKSGGMGLYRWHFDHCRNKEN